MTESDFWRIIDAGAGASFARRSEVLRASLEALPSDEVASFDRLFQHSVAGADTIPLMDAATLIGGGCSSDGFVDFRRWLISAGSRVYASAVADADTLADVEFGGVGGEEDCFFESFGYISQAVYEEMTGTSLRGRAPTLEQSMARLDRLQSAEDQVTPLPRLRAKYLDAER